MEEIWKDISGYEGLYQVSNLGRVRGLDRILKNRYSSFKYKGCVLKQNKANRYNQVCLSRGNTAKNFAVHRLVAKAFIPNPYNYPCVNHINEDRFDNQANNLEWCTHKYNVNYGTRTKRVSKSMIGVNSKPIIQKDLSGNVIKLWKSGKEIERETGILSSGVCQCCKGYIKTFKGYKWSYE